LNQAKINGDSNLVYASWEGSITGEQRHLFRDMIMDLCEKKGVKKFIVDLTKQTNGTNIKDNYEFGKQLRRKMMGYTIAAVYKKGGITEDLLIETIQRGRVNIQVFYSLDDAKKWINNQ
jgi:hypothetical protein